MVIIYRFDKTVLSYLDVTISMQDLFLLSVFTELEDIKTDVLFLIPNHLQSNFNSAYSSI